MIFFLVSMCTWGFYQDHLFLDPFVHVEGRTEMSSQIPSCSPYLLSKEAKNIMQDESTQITMNANICQITTSKTKLQCEISENALGELKNRSHMFTEEKADAGTLGNAKFKIFSLIEKRVSSQAHYFYGEKEGALHAVRCFGEYQPDERDYVINSLKALTKSIVPFL